MVIIIPCLSHFKALSSLFVCVAFPVNALHLALSILLSHTFGLSFNIGISISFYLYYSFIHSFFWFYSSSFPLDSFPFVSVCDILLVLCICICVRCLPVVCHVLLLLLPSGVCLLSAFFLRLATHSWTYFSPQHLALKQNGKTFLALTCAELQH